MIPTPEQQNILEFIRSSKQNLMIRARAGCGKSSTLKLIDKAQSSAVPALVICFNKSIKEELIRSGDFRSSTTINNFNSIGHKIWADHCKKRLTLDKQKILNIYRTIVDEAPRTDRKHLWAFYDQVSAAVNMARAIGYIPDKHVRAPKRLADFTALERRLDETLLPDARGLIDRILIESIRLAYTGTIDFNDQVYMPALFGGTYPAFPLVMIDEYQDLSPVNRAMVAKLCKSSRQIGVGDEAQAIYEFRGADATAMPDAIAAFNMETLPLSVSFRCPSAITSNVHWHVPDIRSAHPGGTILRGASNISIRPDTAVICRYNAPLLHTALAMIHQGAKVDLAGVDIGAKLIKLLTKLGDESLSQAQTLSAVDDWLAERESLDSRTAPDLAESMRVFARHGKTLGQALAYARHVFASTEGELRFMSGHKAKGLEFANVYHLNSSAIKPGGQEQNIHYVIDTRSSDRLTYIEEPSHDHH
jgi:DNA helicase II / ATP-dependent DNA helicase PcrA